MPQHNLPFVSIIVLNYNGKHFLKKCFDSVRKLNYPRNRYEVIMGDNASTDGSVEYVKKYYPWIRIVQFDKNYGFCKPNNVCARKARGTYLAFLNNDTYVDKNWLIEMVKGVLSEKDVVSVACKIFFATIKENGKNLINSAGGLFSPGGGGIYDGLMEEDSEKYSKRRYTRFGCGAGVLVEKKFFLSIGGFDEYYFFGTEEVDIGFRAWSMGHKILYIPSAIMYHYWGGTGFCGGGITPSIQKLITKNKIYFIIKNFESINLIKGLLFNLIYSLLLIFYFLIKNNFPMIRTIILGNAEAINKLKVSFTKRADIIKANFNIKLGRREIYLRLLDFIKRDYIILKRCNKLNLEIFDKIDAIPVIKD